MVSRASVLILCFIQVSLGAGHQSQRQSLYEDSLDIDDVPYMASVHVGGSHCSGSIISQQFVLTAAHCIKKQHRTTDHVRVGSSRRNNGGKKYSIAKYIPHERYRKSSRHSLNYDLGLLKLSRRLTIGYTVATIELVSSNINISRRMHPHVTGWGRTGPEMRSRRLYGPSIIKTSLSICMIDFNNNRLTDKCICAFFYGSEACRVDSGGPLVVGGQQIGVFSVGDNKNCTKTSTGLYVNVTAHLDWINSHINKEQDQNIQK